MLPSQKVINILNKTGIFSFKQMSTITSSNKWQVKEVSIPVPWGEVRGKWWGPTNVRPILTTHGWQDSCGSFDRLIPLLNKKYSFLAIDWPGHGRSSRLPKGMYYYHLNYLLTLKHVINYYKWKKTSFLGHSLGGVSSLLYSIFYPDSVDYVVCLDITKTINEMVEFKRNTGEYIEQFFKFSKHAEDTTTEPPSHTLDEIRRKLAEFLDHSIKYENAHYIYERNIAPSSKHPGKYYFSRDPRVKLDGIFPYGLEDLLFFAPKITAPVLAIKGKQSTYVTKEVFNVFVEEVQKHNKHFKYIHVEGTHHLHLNTPENIADEINKFMLNYDKNAERSKVGSKL